MPTLRGAYLVALGLEPLVLRAGVGAADTAGQVDLREVAGAQANAASGAGRAIDVPPDDGLFGPRPARVCLLVGDAAGFSGPHETLLRAVVQALGLSVAEASFAQRDGVPAIAFGMATDTALAVPALHALRDARAKRAAWPALRRLRRTLRSDA